jgi:hypothetical protein
MVHQRCERQVNISPAAPSRTRKFHLSLYYPYFGLSVNPVCNKADQLSTAALTTETSQLSTVKTLMLKETPERAWGDCLLLQYGHDACVHKTQQQVPLLSNRKQQRQW